MTIRAAFALSIALSALAVAAEAQDAESTNRVAAKTDWSVFVENDPTQCWVVSQPTESVNTRDGRAVAVRRGDIFMFVSFWPGNDQMGEVSFMGGYPFADGSNVELRVGGTTFELFTQGETAWAISPEDDQRIASAMKRGAEAEVIGRSARGTRTADTFSLMGFTAAMEDAERRCAS